VGGSGSLIMSRLSTYDFTITADELRSRLLYRATWLCGLMCCCYDRIREHMNRFLVKGDLKVKVYLLRVGQDAELSSFDASSSSAIPSPVISSTAFRTSSACSRYMLQSGENRKDTQIHLKASDQESSSYFKS